MPTIGIDVSNHNGTVDWTAVKNAGVKFAIIRTGYGRSGEDARFRENIKKALAAGLAVGVYHFSYALNVAGAKEEANFVLKLIKGYEIKMPVFFDFEYDTVDYAKKNGVTLGRQAFNDHAEAFCKIIEAAGYRAGVYYNKDYYNKYVDMSRLGKYVQWYAQYTSTPTFRDYAIWQYTSSGTIKGCSGRFDMNELKDTSLMAEPVKYGWCKDANGWWYRNSDGTWPKECWRQIDGDWYYFDGEGYIVQNLTWQYEGKLYTADGDGRVTAVEVKEVNGEMLECTVYEKLSDVPSYYRPALDKLIDAGLLYGKSGTGEDMVIDMGEDAVRVLVVLTRALEKGGLI